MKKKLITQPELIELLRKLGEGLTQKKHAEQLGISEQYLSDVLKGRRDPGQSVLDALGYQRVVFFELKKKVE